jgi:lysophospholipase L1-like esterase
LVTYASSVRAQRGAAGVFLGAALLISACSSSGSSPGGSANSGGPPPTSPPPATGAPNQIDVSIGDSYAAGYQPTAPHQGSTTRNGFAYQVVDAARSKGYDLKLTNFGCGGATTTSVLTQAGCRQDGLGPGAAQYAPATQASAAEAFLKQHRGQVALITVSIGGNDVTSCGQAQDTVACVVAAVASIKTNLATLLNGVRDAAGPSARIVGITYPDVILGDYLAPDPAKRRTAELSVTAFKSLINPALKAEYEKVGGRFVDVTEATGGYGPLTAMTTLAPYGSIPVPVAKVCELTFYCQFQDIHPRTEGYTVISDQVVATLPRRS